MNVAKIKLQILELKASSAALELTLAKLRVNVCGCCASWHATEEIKRLGVELEGMRLDLLVKEGMIAPEMARAEVKRDQPVQGLHFMFEPGRWSPAPAFHSGGFVTDPKPLFADLIGKKVSLPIKKKF